MNKKRKIVERSNEKGVEYVRYAGEPPQVWHRLTPLTAAEEAELDQIEEEFTQELKDRGMLQDQEILTDLARAVRSGRESAKLSLSELAEESGVQKAAISRIEMGKNPNPSIRTIRRIATALGKSVRLTFRKPVHKS